MKKALLVLFGGRQMPNILTMLHEKPDIIVAIVSEDMQHQLPKFESMLAQLFKSKNYQPLIDSSYTVNAFCVKDTKDKCEQAVEKHSKSGEITWIFNITAATSIMSIGAYEAAKNYIQKGLKVRCWYLNTNGNQVVSLFGEPRSNDLFNITLNDYLTIYNCILHEGNLEDHKKYAEDHWLPFTQLLIQNERYIDMIKDVLAQIVQEDSNRKKRHIKVADPERYNITGSSLPVLKEAHKLMLLDDLQVNSSRYNIKLNKYQRTFLNGGWLELYVWNEARQLNIFSDCQWNQKLFNPKEPDSTKNKQELDVALVYKAQLIVIECKTGNEAFKSDTLHKFYSVSHALGGEFVTRILITSLLAKNADRDFQERADEKGVYVVDRTNLKAIKQIIKEQAMHPKKPRV